MKKLFTFFLSCCCLFLGSATASAQDGWAEIATLFSDNSCTGCHGSQSGLSLGSYASFTAGGTRCGSDIASGTTLVDIISTGTTCSGGSVSSMNGKTGGTFDATELARLQDWIDAGAPETVAAVPGCLDPNATNFNENATEEDNSCQYLCAEENLIAFTNGTAFDNGDGLSYGIAGGMGLLAGANNSFGGFLWNAPAGLDLNQTCMSIDMEVTGNPADFPVTLEFRIENNGCGFFPCPWNDYNISIPSPGTYTVGGDVIANSNAGDNGPFDPNGDNPAIIAAIANFSGTPLVGDLDIVFSNMCISDGNCVAEPVTCDITCGAGEVPSTVDYTFLEGFDSGSGLAYGSTDGFSMGLLDGALDDFGGNIHTITLDGLAQEDVCMFMDMTVTGDATAFPIVLEFRIENEDGIEGANPADGYNLTVTEPGTYTLGGNLSSGANINGGFDITAGNAQIVTAIAYFPADGTPLNGGIDVTFSNFYVTDGTCEAQVDGCTDPAALNYDANANTDDGSCTYTTSCPTVYLNDNNLPSLPDALCVDQLLELCFDLGVDEATFDVANVDFTYELTLDGSISSVPLNTTFTLGTQIDPGANGQVCFSATLPTGSNSCTAYEGALNIQAVNYVDADCPNDAIAYELNLTALGGNPLAGENLNTLIPLLSLQGLNPINFTVYPNPNWTYEVITAPTCDGSTLGSINILSAMGMVCETLSDVGTAGLDGQCPAQNAMIPASTYTAFETYETTDADGNPITLDNPCAVSVAIAEETFACTEECANTCPTVYLNDNNLPNLPDALCVDQLLELCFDLGVDETTFDVANVDFTYELTLDGSVSSIPLNTTFTLGTQIDPGANGQVCFSATLPIGSDACNSYEGSLNIQAVNYVDADCANNAIAYELNLTALGGNPLAGEDLNSLIPLLSLQGLNPINFTVYPNPNWTYEVVTAPACDGSTLGTINILGADGSVCETLSDIGTAGMDGCPVMDASIPASTYTAFETYEGTDADGNTIIVDNPCAVSVTIAEETFACTLEQPEAPTTACYETATFNEATCEYDITGEQPTEPTDLACYQSTSFDEATCMWVISGDEPMVDDGCEFTDDSYDAATCEVSNVSNCPEGTSLNSVDCTCETDVVLGCTDPCGSNYNPDANSDDGSCLLPEAPTDLACYETATYNGGTCTWEVTGEQPEAPATACYETATFNDATCSWDVTGEQDAEPTDLACYQSTSFDEATCMWVISGDEPMVDDGCEFTDDSYDAATCEVINVSNCPEGTSLNSVDCSCDTDVILGCTDPCGSNYNPDANADDGSCLLPEAPTDLACYEVATYNGGTCTWEVTGEQPEAPATACYETATFNDATCSWDVTGEQDAEPTDLACYESASFDEGTCAWVISGDEPMVDDGCEFTDDSYDAATCEVSNVSNCPEGTSLNSVDCSCDTDVILGCTDPCGSNYNPDANADDGSCLLPEEPTDLACYETATYNSTTCTWEVTGEQPIIDDGCDVTIDTFDAENCVAVNTPDCPDGSTFDAENCECTTAEILGCTDATACNFNPSANTDDGSCQTPMAATISADVSSVCVGDDTAFVTVTIDDAGMGESTQFVVTDGTGTTILGLPSSNVISLAGAPEGTCQIWLLNYYGELVAPESGLVADLDICGALSNPIDILREECTVNGSISSIVYEDTNRNGTQDAGEMGIEGVVISLIDADGNTVQTVTTNADGSYSFDDVASGTYTISADYTGDLEAVSATTIIVEVNAGEAVTFESNFSYAPPVDDTCLDFAIETQVICFAQSQTYQVAIVVVGGSGSYTVDMGDGAMALDAIDGQAYMLVGPFAEVSGYTITVADAVEGCSETASGSVDCTTTAIELMTFTATAQERGNELNWITATEFENAYFAIMKSVDGINFTTITQVQAVGNSTTPQAYNFTDEDIANTVVYYRLDAVDINGERTASDILKVERAAHTDMSISPIPASNFINVDLMATQADNINFTIYDVSGKVVLTQQVEVNVGNNVINIDISNMGTGVYFLAADATTINLRDTFIVK